MTTEIYPKYLDEIEQLVSHIEQEIDRFMGETKYLKEQMVKNKKEILNLKHIKGIDQEERKSILIKKMLEIEERIHLMDDLLAEIKARQSKLTALIKIHTYI